MRIRHPRALDGEPPGIAIDVAGEHVTPDSDGYYDIGDRRGWLERYARANGVDADALIVADDADPEQSDADEWARALADEHWRTVVSEVEAGNVDDLLDDLEAIDDRQSVQEAIDARRDELDAGD